MLYIFYVRAAHAIKRKFYSEERLAKSLREPSDALFPAEITLLLAFLISHPSSITGKGLSGPRIPPLSPLLPPPFLYLPLLYFLSEGALINGDR